MAGTYVKACKGLFSLARKNLNLFNTTFEANKCFNGADHFIDT